MKKSHFLGHNLGHKLTLLSLDFLSIFFTFYVISKIRVNIVPDFLGLEFIGITVIIISCIFIGNGYASDSIARQPKLPLRTFFLTLASIFPGMLLIYFLGIERFNFLFGRGVYPTAIIVVGLLTAINRFLVNRYLFKQKLVAKTIAILGETNCQKWLDESLKRARLDVDCKYYLNQSEIKQDEIAGLVITPEYELNTQDQEKLINLRLTGTPTFSLFNFIEKFLFLIPVQEISNKWLIHSTGFTMLHSSVALRIKRVCDISASLLLFILTLPITIGTILLIRIVSPGQVFFSQVRVGMNGKEFRVYKFRTMHIDAESKGAQWASKNDPRIITGGNFLRKTRIDEIPQCWNILKGEMSFIGPRPERPEFTSMLNKEIPYYDLRHVIKPGLTGWAQVKYPYGASTEDSLRKLQFDLYYIKNYSLLLDLNILLRTIKITLMRGGR